MGGTSAAVLLHERQRGVGLETGPCVTAGETATSFPANAQRSAAHDTDPAKPGTKWEWLPKSKIEFVRKSQSLVEVTMPKWLAKEKGLI